MSDVRELRVDVHADILCPWSYIAKRRLERAASGIAGARVVLVWRSFELDPNLGRAPTRSAAQAIRAWRREEAAVHIERIVTSGAREDLELDLERAGPVRTFDAHRIVHLAAEVGRADAAMERLLRAYFTEGENVADHDVLSRLAAEIGLEVDAVCSLLAGERLADEVRSDARLARERGITSVPTLVARGAAPVPAVRPVTELREWLELAT